MLLTRRQSNYTLETVFLTETIKNRIVSANLSSQFLVLNYNVNSLLISDLGMVPYLNEKAYFQSFTLSLPKNMIEQETRVDCSSLTVS